MDDLRCRVVVGDDAVEHSLEDVARPDEVAAEVVEVPVTDKPPSGGRAAAFDGQGRKQPQGFAHTPRGASPRPGPR